MIIVVSFFDVHTHLKELSPPVGASRGSFDNRLTRILTLVGSYSIEQQENKFIYFCVGYLKKVVSK